MKYRTILPIVIIIFSQLHGISQYGPYEFGDQGLRDSSGLQFAFSNYDFKILKATDNGAIKAKANVSYALHRCTWFSSNMTAICVYCHVDRHVGNHLELEKLADTNDIKITHNLMQTRWWTEGPQIVVEFENENYQKIHLIWYWDPITRQLKIMTP